MDLSQSFQKLENKNKENNKYKNSKSARRKKNKYE